MFTFKTDRPTVDPSLSSSIVPRFIGLDSATAKRFPTGQHPCQGLYWALPGHHPSVVFMLSHYIADFSEHFLGGPLAERGYGLLGWNTRYTGAEDRFILEDVYEDMAVGTQWIRKEIGFVKIVFIGNSGGGSLMAAFQAQAEKTPSLIGADAFIFLNAHPGRADIMVNWIDPSVVDELDPVKTDSSLDMYDPKNGPPYLPEFVQKYRAAQLARSQRITDWVKKELKRLNEAGIPDRVFPVYRTMADLRFMDPSIDPSDRPCPSCYAGPNPPVANRGISMVARASTLRTWLSMWSMDDSPSRFERTGPAFTIPTLVLQGTADVGVHPSDAKKIFDLVGSKDKQIHLIKGAPHFFEDGPESLQHAVDLIESWVKQKLEV